MNLIVAVDNEWGIGNKGDLLVRIKGDLKQFAHLTTGKIVVLGSGTLATFPGGRVLKNRTNIILSRRSDYAPEGAIVVRSVEEALSEIKKYNSCDVFVIGGASIYEQFLPYCDRAYVTKIDGCYEKDRFLQNLDDSPEWKLTDCGEILKSNPETDSVDVTYRFTVYERIK